MATLKKLQHALSPTTTVRDLPQVENVLSFALTEPPPLSVADIEHMIIFLTEYFYNTLPFTLKLNFLLVINYPTGYTIIIIKLILIFP